MTREEAQFILGSYRPDCEDAYDPQFQEALALVRQDPALARWFADEQALDRAFSAKIRSHPIPPDLKAQLLFARMTAAGTKRWRQPVWLAAAAACVALLFVLTFSLVQRRAHSARFDEYRSAMTTASLDMNNHVEVMGLDAAGYKLWLVEHQGESDFILPPILAGSGIAACKVIKWQERRATMLCFKISGRHLDVFVLDAADLPGVSLGLTPKYFVDARATVAAWQREGKIYLLAGAMSKADLQQFL